MRQIASACALVILAAPLYAACSENIVTVKGEFGQARFQIDVADEPQERARGLMFVETMPTLNGMLFVYDTPQHATFWMRNTLIPLDMIFTGVNGEILKIHQNAMPLDETTIDGGEDVLFVLEINGGLSARLGIQEGDALQHPAINLDPIHPCEN